MQFFRISSIHFPLTYNKYGFNIEFAVLNKAKWNLKNHADYQIIFLMQLS